MAGRYLIRVRQEFSAAHVLHGYAGACNRVHGHNWNVEAEIECLELDGVGMGIDFREVRSAMGRLVEGLDHRLLNEVPPFDEVNPTAENVAAYVFQRLPRELPALSQGAAARLIAVTVAENDRSSVRYEGLAPAPHRA